MNTFVALGGGDEVGASCYYLKLGEANIMLDCGSRNGVKRYPYFDTLIENKILTSSNDLDIIAISHAHKDHYAALPTVANLKDSRIISTPQTKKQIKSMIDKLYKSNYFNDESEKFSFKHLVSTIFEFDYFEIVECKGVNIMFVPAGHIPGAAITVLTYEDTKVVYTGDFSLPLSEDESYNDLAMRMMMDCDLLIMENTNGDKLKSKKLLSKHSNCEEMMDFIGIIHPKELFLVHQNSDSFYDYGLKNEVEKYYSSIRTVKVKNKNIYNWGYCFE